MVACPKQNILLQARLRFSFIGQLAASILHTSIYLLFPIVQDSNEG